MYTHLDDPNVRALFELTIGKRPEEELYDLQNDPEQMVNLAAQPDMSDKLKALRYRVEAEMKRTDAPRLTDAFDFLPWSDPSKPKVMNRKRKQFVSAYAIARNPAGARN